MVGCGYEVVGCSGGGWLSVLWGGRRERSLVGVSAGDDNKLLLGANCFAAESAKTDFEDPGKTTQNLAQIHRALPRALNMYSTCRMQNTRWWYKEENV